LSREKAAVGRGARKDVAAAGRTPAVALVRQQSVMRFRLTSLGVAVSRPAAMWVLGAYAVSWAVFDRASLNWSGIATLATLFMTLLIQRAEHRNTLAVHAKIDELLSADNRARNKLAEINQREPEEIERHRRHAIPPD
jgi:low affinity Fe/Cu permease